MGDAPDAKPIHHFSFVPQTCKDCVFWGLNEPHFGYEGPGGNRGLRGCGNPKNGLNAPDAMNSYESIGTGPDFGCVHWTTKA